MHIFESFFYYWSYTTGSFPRFYKNYKNPSQYNNNSKPGKLIFIDLVRSHFSYRTLCNPFPLLDFSTTGPFGSLAKKKLRNFKIQIENQVTFARYVPQMVSIEKKTPWRLEGDK